MKKVLVLVSLMSLSTIGMANNGQDSLNWTLSFSTTYNNINIVNAYPYKTQILLGEFNKPIGRGYYYSTSQGDFFVRYFWEPYNDEDIVITGKINGKSFIMTNCKINVCNGPKGTIVDFILKDSTGIVKAASLSF